MRFTHDSKIYDISFKRHYGTMSGRGDLPLAAPTRHRYTTVDIGILSDDGEEVVPYRTATVGCHHTDHFTLEQGRLAALRSVGKALSKDERKEMWDAYINRPKG